MLILANGTCQMLLVKHVCLNVVIVTNYAVNINIHFRNSFNEMLFLLFVHIRLYVMTYLQLMSYIERFGVNNRDMKLLTKFTAAHYVKFISTVDYYNDNSKLTNKILADNWNLKQIKLFNDMIDFKLNTPRHYSYDSHISMFEPVKEPEFNMVIISNYLHLNLSNALEKYNKQIEYNYNPTETRDHYFLHVQQIGWTVQPWYVKAVVYGESMENIIDVEKYITVVDGYERYNETDIISQFVNNDKKLNNVRKLIITLQNEHAKERQKQIKENRFDKLPFELNEMLQEHAHELLLKCKSFIVQHRK